MKRNIEIEFVRAGQPRPYADHTYEAILTYSGDLGSDPTEDIVREEARVLVRPFKDEGQGDWASARLKEIEKLGKGKWRVVIIEPYLD